MQEISRKERERLTREEDIVNAAEKIFSSMGIEGASMEEIAKQAQFTRKTLYQYFGSKDELLSAVILRGFGLLLSSLQQEINQEITGLEKLQIMGLGYYRFYKEHTGFFNLINYSSRMKTIGKEAQRSDFEKIDNALFQAIARAIEAGKADGSIRGDIDTIMGTSSIMFTITGFFYEFSITGRTFTEHLSLDSDLFVQYTLNLLMEAFRNKQ